MKQGQSLWTREELILAINLYCKTPFGRLHQTNPDVIALANLIGRGVGGVAWKLVNFASLDPSLHARGIVGAKNAGNLTEQIWDEFYGDWDRLAFESERQLAVLKGKDLAAEVLSDLPNMPEGKEKERLVRTRVNQGFFRKTILASYNNKCCITGISVQEFLVAGHIIPWAQDEKNRMNPSNGLCLNALHDKAFEAGLLSVTPKYEIKVAPSLLKLGKKDASIADYFNRYEDASLILPKRFLPDPLFLEQHFEVRFQRI